MRYVIVGNGVAGITAAFTLRDGDPEAEITVVSHESDYFFSRTALMYAFQDMLRLRDLEPFERNVYRDRRITLRRAEASAIEPQRLRLRDGEALPFDGLLLATGSRPRRPAWEGLSAVTTGAVHFVSLQDLEACEQAARLARRAVVVGGGLIGIELVECLRHFGIDTTFLVREPHYWPAALHPPESEMVTAHMRRHGVHVELEEEVVSVEQQEGRATGVRTSSGRLHPCDLLGIAIGVEPNIEWLRGILETGRGIRIDHAFRTSFPLVWAAGDCAEHESVEQLWYSAKRQGALAARSMLGENVHYQPPLFFNSAKFFGIEYTTVGQVTRLPAGTENWYRRLPGPDRSIRIVSGDDGCVIGFNMLGSRWDHQVLEGWIRDGRTREQVLPRLAQAQFDVEFGRAAVEALR